MPKTESDHVQISADGGTVWVHADDGSTVGRFSRRFGMDVHSTASAQLTGASQCLHCTHAPAGKHEWMDFCRLILEHHGIEVDVNSMHF